MSIHSKKLPFEKQCSDIDIELDDGMEDEEYLSIVNQLIKKIESQDFNFVFL